MKKRVGGAVILVAIGIGIWLNSLFNGIGPGGEGTNVGLSKDVQWNHRGTDLVHLDLTRVSLDERVTVEVEIELHGEPAALKETGAILEQPVTVIEIETLATTIPDMLAGNLEGLTIDEPTDTIIATIHIVEEEPEEEQVSEGEAAEPELIGKADEEEGDEGEVEEK